MQSDIDIEKEIQLLLLQEGIAGVVKATSDGEQWHIRIIAFNDNGKPINLGYRVAKHTDQFTELSHKSAVQYIKKRIRGNSSDNSSGN